MSKEMKYVMVNGGVSPVLFSDANSHADFSYLHPTSAGMCQINKEGDKFTATCYGRSTSMLGLEPDGYDHKAIELMLNDY